ncbi:hypothetical protein [Hyphomicrobium sp. MC8b]|uniref:hypothetical protein n=1 Tax=Hyphomicrobium sp. MC8b TaxID=300273 RepID=UPI00391A9E35
MNNVSEASALVAIAIAVFVTASPVMARECPVLRGCAGMELAQDAAPDDGAPDANSAQPPSQASPDDGSSGDDSAQSPDDDGGNGDDGDNSDQASPPDSAQPPGCPFDDRPLELLV